LSAATVTDFGFALDVDLDLDLGADRFADFRFALAMTQAPRTLLLKHATPLKHTAKSSESAKAALRYIAAMRTQGSDAVRTKCNRLRAWDNKDASAAQVPFCYCFFDFHRGRARPRRKERLTHDTRFCPSWAEAHERTLASLNNGRPPYPVKWKGCIVLKRGARRHHRPWRPMDGNCRPRQALVR